MGLELESGAGCSDGRENSGSYCTAINDSSGAGHSAGVGRRAERRDCGNSE